MEDQTRFGLNAAVENWRQELAAQIPLSAEDRRELETHLRDSFTELKSRGLNEEESFWLARRRVGQPKKLAEEFFKADPAKAWRERVFWMWLAIFLFNVLGRITNSLVYAMLPNHVRWSPSFTAQRLLQTVILITPILIPLILSIFLVNGT
jgi:hypothetical protein